MSASHEIVKAVAAPGAVVRPPAPLGRAETPALGRRLAGRLGNAWMPRATWAIRRTGRPGLVGIALLLGAALFLLSTYLKVAADVEGLRADLAAQGQAHTAVADQVADPAAALRALPARTDMPAILRHLFNEATQAKLVLESGKYEINATRSGDLARYRVTFPVSGPYPQVRAFIDGTLATMPAVALDDLVLERKSIGDANVEAQIRLSVYTAAAGTRAQAQARAAPSLASAPEDKPRASEARPASGRVVAPTHAGALFAQHSWYVLPPAPPPAPPPPAPEPTAPPFPDTFVGSFTPEGQPPVFFLSRGDRVIDAHVGDVLDGVYRFESAAGGQLVFVYLPLNTHQNIAAGASR